MNSKKYLSSIPWWYWIIIIDVFLLFVTVTARHGIEFPQSWRLYSAFNLGSEMNLSVWWSGMLLLTISLLCYEFYKNKTSGFDRPWLSLAAVFFILSIDEICSLHERLPKLWLAGVLMPLIFFLALYPLIVFMKDIKNQKTGVYILFGFGLYASVLGQEILEFAVEFPAWFLGIRTGIEEGSELLGTFVILFGVLALRDADVGISFQKVVPKPQFDYSFRVLLWLGIIVHILVCWYILPTLDDLDERGNPGAFYPTLINFFVFCFLFWKAKDLQGFYSKVGFALAVIFLLCSMGSMADLLRLVPMSSKLFSEDFIIEGFQLIYVVQIISVIISLIISEKSRSMFDLLFIILLVGVFALSFTYDSLIYANVLPGLSVFIIGCFYSRLYNKA